MIKHITAIVWLYLCLFPTQVRAENPVPLPEIACYIQSSSLNEEQSGHNLVISEAMVKDDELVQMVGHGLQTPFPKGAVIYGGTGILPARIKLWDEVKKVPVNVLHSHLVLFKSSMNSR